MMTEIPLFLGWEIRNWLDDELPALGGLTPREAAKSVLGREKLEALLLHFESSNERETDALNAHFMPDVAFLRKELGI